MKKTQPGLMEHEIDVAELWLDQAVTGEMLIELDPLDITFEMVEIAEQPELGDWAFLSISGRQLSHRQALALWKCTKAELQAKYGGTETIAAFMARLTGS